MTFFTSPFRYVIAVGWDRCINIYPDTSEGITSVQFPLKIWDDDKVRRQRWLEN